MTRPDWAARCKILVGSGRVFLSFMLKLKIHSLAVWFCCMPMFSVNTGAAERTIAAITSKTIGDNVSQDERQYYLDVLRGHAQDAITQFLIGLHLTSEQIAGVEAIDVESLDGKCLDQNTLFAIYEAVRGTCTTIADDDVNFISSIIIPKFDRQITKVTTNFFPYGLNRLKLAEPPSNKVLEYVDSYPSAAEPNEKFDTLLILGFLNLYWDHVKDKPRLNETELTILYSGFAQYGNKLQNLCLKFGPGQKVRCENMAREAIQLSLAAKSKQP